MSLIFLGSRGSDENWIEPMIETLWADLGYPKPKNTLYRDQV